MIPRTADRNLLFGILALQMDFVTRDQLVAAMNGWVLAKTKSLGQLLLDQGALSRDRFALLEALVQEHVKLHGNDPEKSLAALSSPGSVHAELKRIADPDLQASLGHVPVARAQSNPEPDPYATGGLSIGASTSTGLRFRVLRPHARGGLGEVLVAQDQELHREVALKQIQGAHADNPDNRTRFVLEAEITGGLEHPGIVPVYGLGQYADGRPYYAMRFIRGDSLKDALERFHKAEVSGTSAGQRNLELRRLLGRLIDVCQAIAYAHSRGVLHRDLKPGNIMLGKYGETLVVDWGLAKPLDQPAEALEPGEGTLTLTGSGSTTNTLMGTALGTPQFMSPEQAAGQLNRMGPASDVYSLGATLYCVLTGKTPFADVTDVGEVLRKVERGDFAKPRQIKADIPRALEAICLQAMAKKPEDRYASPRLLAEDLEHWLADEPVSAWPEPWTVKARRWLRRHRTLATGLASAVMVATVGLAVATVLLTAANARERQAKEEALVQRQLAEDNFRMARQAVDRYHTEVSEDILLREPGMEPLRKKLLGAAREFYDKFVEERGGDPKMKQELGRALFRLAQITSDIESDAKAIDLHTKAQAIFVALGPGCRDELARCYHHLGRLYRLTDRSSESEESYKNAVTIFATLVKEQGPFEAELARSHLGLGTVYQKTHRLQLARAEYLKALAMRQRLAVAHPEDATLQRDLAVTHSNLGMVLLATGDKDRTGRQALLDAVTIQEKLVKAAPHISQYKDDLARSYYLLGDYCLGINQLDQALTYCAQAAALWEELVARHAEVVIFQTRLTDAYAALANVHRLNGKADKAVAICQQALAVRQKLADRHKDVPRYQSDLARGHFQLGNAQRSAGDFDPATLSYQAALEYQAKLAKNPGLPHHLADWARTYHHLGLLRLDQRRWQAAEESFTQAIERWDPLHQAQPASAEFTQGLAAACAQRAKARSHQGEFAMALKDVDQALRLSPDADKVWFRLDRAEILARSGDHIQAVEEAEAMSGSVRGSGEAMVQMACVFALSAGAEAKNPVLPAEDPPLREQYAKRAVVLLQKALAAGHFRQPPNLMRLTKDPIWQIIHARKDFQEVLRAAQVAQTSK